MARDRSDDPCAFVDGVTAMNSNRYKPMREHKKPQYLRTMKQFPVLDCKPEMERLHKRRVWERWQRLQDFKRERREAPMRAQAEAIAKQREQDNFQRVMSEIAYRNDMYRNSVLTRTQGF